MVSPSPLWGGARGGGRRVPAAPSLRAKRSHPWQPSDRLPRHFAPRNDEQKCTTPTPLAFGESPSPQGGGSCEPNVMRNLSTRRTGFPSPLWGGARGGGRRVPAASSLRAKRSNPWPPSDGLPRRFAPRNDEQKAHDPHPARLRRVALPSRGRRRAATS